MLIVGDPMNQAQQSTGYPATSQLLNQLNDAVYMLDRDMNVTFWNRAAERITGYPASRMIGRPCHQTLEHCDPHGTVLCHSQCPMLRAMEHGQDIEAVVYFGHAEGQRVPIAVRICPARNDHGDVIGALQVFSDDAARMMAVQRIGELERLADNDALTGLRNRRFMVESVELRIAEAQRDGGSFGCVFIDLDHFKRINDQWGHETGDNALKVVARTIVADLTPMDTPGRWGGEEFVALIAVASGEALAARAERLAAMIRNCKLYAGSALVPLSASLGATLYQAGDNADTLIQRADGLMYESKRNGRDRVTCDLLRAA